MMIKTVQRRDSFIYLLALFICTGAKPIGVTSVAVTTKTNQVAPPKIQYENSIAHRV